MLFPFLVTMIQPHLCGFHFEMWNFTLYIFCDFLALFTIYTFFYNLVAKATGLNLGKKLSNLLSNHEALN